MYLPPPEYGHLLSLIDDTGIFEHSRYGIPRREHGYTLDDATRAAIVLSGAPATAGNLRALQILLAFILESATPEGRFRNRLGVDRAWSEQGESADDAQGRAIWALAVAAVEAPPAGHRDAARSLLEEVPGLTSRHLRPHLFAVLGAHALWRHDSTDPIAGRLVEAARPHLTTGGWPEARLRYANGRIPAAWLSAGEMLGRSEVIDAGLEMLSWLLEVETGDGHLSFTSHRGWAPGESRPAFDQQAIEAAALADAAERAWLLTGEARWRDAVLECGRWLLGANDSGMPLYDSTSGATYDGLTEAGVNANTGAESTIAGLAVLQACQRLSSHVGAAATVTT